MGLGSSKKMILSIMCNAYILKHYDDKFNKIITTHIISICIGKDKTQQCEKYSPIYLIIHNIQI